MHSIKSSFHKRVHFVKALCYLFPIFEHSDNCMISSLFSVAICSRNASVTHSSHPLNETFRIFLHPLAISLILSIVRCLHFVKFSLRKLGKRAILLITLVLTRKHPLRSISISVFRPFDSLIA